MACESVRSVYVLPWFRVLSLIEDNMPLTRIQFSVDSKLFVIGQVSSSNVQINVAEFGSVTNAVMSPIRESETKPKIVEFAVTTATTEAKTSYNYKFFPVHNKFSPFCEVKLMKLDQRWVLFDVQRTLANCPSTSSVLDPCPLQLKHMSHLFIPQWHHLGLQCSLAHFSSFPTLLKWVMHMTDTVVVSLLIRQLAQLCMRRTLQSSA